MAGLNRVFLIGYLGADPELRYTASGQAVAEIRLATSESWKDKDGNKHEKAEWHRLVAWGKTGELCAKYLAKGRQAYFEGRIQTRSYDDKDGNKKYITEIVVNEVQFLGGGRDSDGRGAQRGSDGGEQERKGFSGDEDEDRIPF